MTGQERIGIVVPVGDGRAAADGGRALRATLQSLRDQTEAGFSVWLVCAADVPIDPPVADPRFRLVAAEGRDRVALLRAGIDASATPWIRFLPVGDQLAPRCLETELAALDRAGDVALVFSAGEDVDAEGRVLASADPSEPRRAVPPGRHEAGALLPELVAANPFPLGSALVRRETFLELGGFDPSLVARPEHDLWLRLLGGHAAWVEPTVGLRVRTPAIAPSLPEQDGEEHARVLLRALRGEVLEQVVRALGGGERTAPSQGIARTELARRLMRADRIELRPLVLRLLREARGVGAYFPTDAAFAPMAAELPELARSEGWFPPPPGPDRGADLATVPPGAFRPSVRVGLGVGDEAAPGGVGTGAATRDLVERRAALEALGLEMVIVHARSSREASPPDFGAGVGTEILRHEGSVDEAEEVLARSGVSLLVANDGHPAAAAARRRGLPVCEWASVDLSDPSRLARSWLREAAAAAARERRSARADAAAAARAVGDEAAEDATLRVLVSALGEAAARARPEPESPGLLDRLAEARGEAEIARRRLAEVDDRTRRALDKLRIGRRLRSTFGRGPIDRASEAPRVVSFDAAVGERFLERAASSGARLWVVYTTDPYSETQGQRSTWLARELLSRGDFVVFFYWRWHLSDAIAPTPHDRLLPVPIDQFFRLQRPLMELAAPGLEKVFLIEFPDAQLFEQVDLANAHGFTTVYDCVDDWEEFARLGHAHWYDPGVERHLARHTDVAVVTHPALVGRLRDLGRPSAPIVPNGVALDAFAGAAPRARRGSPVVGYFGHLTPAWFDWELVRETAAAHPEWQFELFGPGAPAGDDATPLPGNVVVPGAVPHDELEQRTRSWHVGIVPFRPGRLTEAVDPIKLYEYLALGLPAVVVGMPHLEGVPGVEVCRREDFGSALGRAIESEMDRVAVDAFLASSRWSVRTDSLCEVIARAPRRDLLKAL